MEEWFIIKDIKKFINATRSLVYNSFGNESNSQQELQITVSSKKDKDELDKILSYNESYLIGKEFFRQQTNKKNLKKRYLISDSSYHKFVGALNSRMIGNILNGLVNKGLVESSFDSETNDFIFWVKEQPETNN